MTVTDRQLGVLAAVAVAMVILTAVLSSTDRSPRLDVRTGALLIPDLDLAQVHKIVLTEKDASLTLVRTADGFAVADKHRYPAATKKLNDLLIKCLEIRIAEKVTEDPANHAELGVTRDSEDATFVAFYGERPAAEAKAKAAEKKGKAAEETQPIVGLLVGKSASHGTGNYVRLLGHDTVYASEESVWLSTSATSYMDTDIVDLKKEDIQKVAVKLPEESYTIARDENGKVVLQDIPEGKQAKQSEVDSVFGALTWLSFNDVLPASEVDAPWDAVYTCQLKDEKHLTYILRLAKKDDTHSLRIRAQGPPPALVEQSRRVRTDQEMPKEEMERRDAILTAADKADAFTTRHRPWAYEIASWKAEKMRTPLADLIEDIPEPETPEEGEEPEEISARHILIAYKGAQKAGEDVTRTKDEAKTLAEKVLKEVRAEGADFAELAKKYSDGPSGDKGGDLGSFKKGAMHENFEKAAWALDVNGISGVVETPFGFHIIQRTK